MKGVQQSFVGNVKPKKFNTMKRQGSPTADCKKIRDLLMSFSTLTAKNKESGALAEIYKATVQNGKCMVMIHLTGEMVRLDDLEIIENFDFKEEQ